MKKISIEDLGLTEAVVAELRQEGFCKLEITYRLVKSRRGRPKATSKSLADYVCSGVDADALKEEVKQRLKTTNCQADDVAQLEKTFIAEHKINALIPHVILKEEFGELINFSRQALNRREKALKLR